MTDSRPPSDSEFQPEHINALIQSDAAVVRVLEDLVDVLISRGVIQFTDLPPSAQDKLLSRRQTRAKLKDHLQLLPGDGDGGLI